MQEPPSQTHLLDSAPGTMIQARYRIERGIGSGAQASVFLAEDVHLLRPSALKLFQHSDQKLVERFRKEANLMASLDHPNIVKVYSSGTTDDGRHFIAMEYVEGGSLASYLQKQGKLTAAEFISIFSQILSALNYLHSNSILHRDLKPANILLSFNPDNGEIKAKLGDFGIAKIYDESSNATSLTQTKGIGTAAYMSPEQCQGRPLDPRSDIYAVGCVMFESLAGKPPFLGESEYEVMYKHTSSAIPKLPISSEVANILSKALAKQAAERWQSAQEMLEAMPSATGLTDLTWDEKRQMRNPTTTLIAVSCIVLVGLVLAGYFYQSNHTESVKMVKRAQSATSIKEMGDYLKIKADLSRTGTLEQNDAVRRQANKILKDTEDSKVEQAKVRQLALHALAQLEHIKGQRQKSLDYSNQAIEELAEKGVRDLDSSMHMVAFQDRAMRKEAANKSDEAILDWEQALQYARKIPPEERFNQQGYIYGCIANNYLNQNRLDLAEKPARTSISFALEDGPENGIAIDSKYLLIKILLRKGKSDEANTLIKELRDVTMKKLPVDNYNFHHWPARLINIGAGFGAQGKYDLAIKYLKEAEEVYAGDRYKKEFVISNYDESCRSQGLDSLAVYQKLSGNKKEAGETCKKAIDLLAPQESAHCVDTLVSLGINCKSLGLEDEALRAWSLAEEKLQKYDDTIAGAVGRPPGILLGEHYLNAKQPEKALRYFESALKFLQTKEPARTIEIKEAKTGIRRAKTGIRKAKSALQKQDL